MAKNKSTLSNKQRQNGTTLVFDQRERIDFVKGFGKRKQERRERAKREALEKEREIRKLLRQKRKEALKRAQAVGSGGEGGGNEDKTKQASACHSHTQLE